MLVLGDCNDSSFKSSRFRYMFDYLEGVGFAHVVPPSGDYPHTRVNGSQIDHIFASEGIRQGSMVANSFQSHTVEDSERAAYRATFSDHFPVTVDIEVGPDADATLDEIAVLPDATERAERFAELSEVMRAEEAAVEIPDDEEVEPISVEAEIIDAGFERILAPQPGGVDGGEAGLAESAAVRPGTSPTGPAAGEGAAAPDRADSQSLMRAIGIIQDEMRNLIANADQLSAEDAEKLEAFMIAEQALVRQAIASRTPD